ncbi:MAG: metallophosphoesterase family protein, partial [Pseudonocardiaceae bacterium]
MPDSTGAPTKIALLTDVHGNLPAFIAVLADVDTQNVDAIWFLGDLVGYGAQPDECVKLAAERCDLCLAGNHDLGVLDRIDIGDFSP